MKPVLLSNYKINGRAIAEAMWGTGGTNAIRTNRKGAYYYSCSSHGGYVVSSSCLTEDEKARLHEYMTPESIQVLVQHRIDGDYVIGVSLSNIQTMVGKSKTFRYSPSEGMASWQDIKVYIFEEDCDWAILEKLTDICLVNASKVSESEHQKIIDDVFNRWAKVSARG